MNEIIKFASEKKIIAHKKFLMKNYNFKIFIAKFKNDFY